MPNHQISPSKSTRRINYFEPPTYNNHKTVLNDNGFSRIRRDLQAQQDESELEDIQNFFESDLSVRFQDVKATLDLLEGEIQEESISAQHSGMGYCKATPQGEDVCIHRRYRQTAIHLEEANRTIVDLHGEIEILQREKENLINKLEKRDDMIRKLIFACNRHRNAKRNFCRKYKALIGGCEEEEGDSDSSSTFEYGSVEAEADDLIKSTPEKIEKALDLCESYHSNMKQLIQKNKKLTAQLDMCTTAVSSDFTDDETTEQSDDDSEEKE